MNNIYDLFITRTENQQIKKSPGIYVLFSDDKIPLYVGKSEDLRSRVKSHLTSNGNPYIEMHTGKFYYIGIIYHSDLTTIYDKETEIIHLLQPALNKAKINYLSDINLTNINEYEMYVSPKCRFNIGLFKTCGINAQNDGYCTFHDPENHKFPWLMHGKLITTEMQRLLYDSEHSRLSLYFYMNNITFGKLLSEKTFAKIDYINEEIVLNFKKHFIIIDEVDTIRLEIKRQP